VGGTGMRGAQECEKYGSSMEILFVADARIFMQFHAVSCSSMQHKQVQVTFFMLFHAVPCSSMQHENVNVMFFMLFHAVSCSSMQFHAVPCYSPKLGETATDTKHANFDWRTLEAMQVQYLGELRISNETLSATRHGKHGRSCKTWWIFLVSKRVIEKEAKEFKKI
jgi:hypothetical protein